ncbi:hypothetical protein Q4E93_15785 [Flavitalea sp. BT771]|uniref:hypothetical protein n=1 Tax=Flavitalea sp. BT771 TaxID=3063329 RepID=UPI0026E1921D|nr:hypothetical protein [Flavitalea sp. BT771]MDO6432063.1 hypothetical protein [Flavitalea sp. BT771]MDV6220972.1 hypothetical protein [Flavitalea sp. BT771]
MQYLSPSTILGESITTPIDKKAIQLGRKKLLAELELSEQDSLEVHGIHLTKGNIIDYFEALQQDNVIDYHNAIEEDNVLKIFLEDHSIADDTKFRNNPLYSDGRFIQWISPYFLTAFTTATDRCFRYKEKDELITILENQYLMTDYDLEQAWSSLIKILTNNIALLEYYTKKGEQGKGDKQTFDAASPLMGYQYISLIVLLPEHRFGEIRNRYAFVIELAAIYTFNKKTAHRLAAETWVENALLLAVAPELQTELTEKLKEMRRISKPTKDRSPFWNIARFAWLLIFIAAKAFTCNTSDPSYTPKYEMPNNPWMHDSVEGQKDNTLQLTDSTRKLLLDSFNRVNQSPLSPHRHPYRSTDHTSGK